MPSFNIVAELICGVAVGFEVVTEEEIDVNVTYVAIDLLILRVLLIFETERK